MAAEIQLDEITRILTGTVVRSVGRAADMGVVEFDGLQGETVMIHMQCPFRIVRNGRILVGSRDMRYAQKGAGPQAFDEFRMIYDAQTTTLNGALGQLRPSVDGVTVGEAGELTVSWEQCFRLEVFPDCSGKIEAWRAFVRGGAHHGFPPETI
ncbi:hypothetical protein [Streptomyces caniscabiei]|uniref:hypothetical protein n=1 Tax=Streptomyces caniscabiei TaxID=2746961 RepID=UPI0029AAEA1C|nr:hypothetical protein [Streptomyces caniscabiei]MDX3729753.1 hypothetical protein [Streptomyces caniscabiei]